jgi:cytochrome b6-f complex iron-sulfur subunit
MAYGTLITGGVVVTGAAIRIPVPQTGMFSRRFTIGEINQYPVNHFTFLPGKNIYIFRDRKGLKAVSAVCTHLGCILRISESGFRCPCHGSTFNKQGEVRNGPAVRNLEWYEINREPDGRIVVSGDRIVSPDKFLKL